MGDNVDNDNSYDKDNRTPELYNPRKYASRPAAKSDRYCSAGRASMSLFRPDSGTAVPRWLFIYFNYFALNVRTAKYVPLSSNKRSK